MILTSLLAFALSFSNPTPSTGTYDFTSHISSSEECPVLIMNDVNGGTYFVDTNVIFDADINFGQESYFLYNVSFTVEASHLYLNNQSPEFDNSCRATYNFDWEITQNSYYQQFSKTQFIVSLVAGQYEMSIDCKYDGVYYGQYSTCTIDCEYSYTSSLTISIDGSYLMNAVETFVADNMYYLGYSDGYIAGHADGIEYADEQGSTAATIFTGICNIGLMPVNFFLGILNFEVFGINIGAFVSALLTIAIIAIIIKVVTGNSSGGDSK